METHLCYHHMAVKGSLTVCGSWAVDVGANLGDYGGSKGHIGHKVAVHDVDLAGVSSRMGISI